MVEATKKLGASAAKSWACRTYKREVALGLLIVWGVSTLFLLIVTSIERMVASGGIYGTMTAAVFTFALAAFGYDAWVKQPTQLGVPAPSTTPGTPR